MLPTFHESSFLFKEGEQVPEHNEDSPSLSDQDPGKWWLRGTDMSKHNNYVLAINVDDAGMAGFLMRARLRELKRSQPSASSDEQEFDGIQDGVNAISPGEPIQLQD